VIFINKIQKYLKLLFIILGILSLVTSIAIADDAFPTKPIQMIIPYGAGGTTDLFNRAMSSVIREYLKQSMLLVNKPGASGIEGTVELSKSKPDGYTIGWASSSNTVTAPIYLNAPYD